MRKDKRAFTMIELLAVLVILGIIMAITIPTISYFLKGNSKDYYSKLEKTIVSSSQDFFNDYRINLPKDIGHVKRVTIESLVQQKYSTAVLGIDKKACSGDVVVQKLTNGNYSYTTCLKCEKKKDGTYGYVSDTKECGYSEENNNKYTILIDGLGDKTSIRIPQAQAYTVPNAKVYVNGQVLSQIIRPTPGTVDVNVLTTYKVYYTFRTLVKELAIKVYDPAKPVISNIIATTASGNIASGVYTSSNVNVNFYATDWTTTSVYGSGIDHLEYQINGGKKQNLAVTTTDNRTYTAGITLSANGVHNITVNAVDKEGNVGSSKTFVVKIDKTAPTAPVITGGSTTWTNGSRTIRVQTDATVPSGIKNYQYYISTSSTGQSGGSWTNLASGVKRIEIKTEGIRYIYFRAISNTGIEGLVSNSQVTKIDKSKPTAPVITGGSTTWTNGSRTIRVQTDATVPSGIKNYQYYISTSSTGQRGGSWTNLASGVKRIGIKTEGIRYIYFRAISNTGIEGLVSNSQVTKIDKSKPTAPVIIGGSTTWTNGSRTIRVQTDATVPSGIKNYQYYISTSSTGQSGGSWTNLASGVKRIEIKTEGIRYIYFRAISNTGIEGLVSNSQVTKIDKIAPTGSIKIASTQSGYSALKVKITLSASDSGGSGLAKMCIQESSSVSNCSWMNYATTRELTLSGTLDGNNRTVYVWFRDNATNVSSVRSSTYRVYKEGTTVDTKWTSCTKLCGKGGTQTSTVTDHFTKKRITSLEKTISCNENVDCCSKKTLVSSASWSACSAACGTGIQTRTLLYKSNLDASVSCNVTETRECKGTNCEAILLPGSSVITRASKVASGSSNIKYIKTTTSVPSGVTSELVSITGAIPVYVYFDSSSSTLYFASTASKIYMNSDSSQLFYGYKNLISIDFGKLDTSKVTNMSYMFRESGMSSLNLSSFNTENVTDMRDMFYQCWKLESINFGSFNTSKVTKMSFMFAWCSKLTNLNLSSFNTINVTDMSDMFYGCSGLTNLNLSNFDTRNVTGMGEMFFNCTGLTSLNISKFNTSKVTNMTRMFSQCEKLTSLNLSSFNTSSVIYMENMFWNCCGLKTLNLSNFNTSNVKYMNGMFSGCNGLTSLNVSSFNTSKVTDMTSMFSGCWGLTSLNVSSFNTSNVTNMYGMFNNCCALTSLNVSNFNTSKVKNMGNMFTNCYSLRSLNLSNFDTRQVTSFGAMFAYTNNLRSVTYGSNFVYQNNATLSAYVNINGVDGKIAMYGNTPANKPTHSSWSGKI